MALKILAHGSNVDCAELSRDGDVVTVELPGTERQAFTAFGWTDPTDPAVRGS